MRPPREFCPKISESRIQNPKLPTGLRIMGQNPESRVLCLGRKIRAESRIGTSLGKVKVESDWN